jgi:hypothetical protein
MSRSGYVHGCDWDGDLSELALYRANVDRAIRGRRGQALLREMAVALDAMPVKELVAGEIVRDSEHVCALGSVALARGLNVADLDVEDGDAVGEMFGVASMLVREIAYKNDECGPLPQAPAERWTRMRAWVAANVRENAGG